MNCVVDLDRDAVLRTKEEEDRIMTEMQFTVRTILYQTFNVLRLREQLNWET